MKFWVYGHDYETGKWTEFFTDARTEDAARAQASEQGIIVERVVFADDDQDPDRASTPEAKPEHIQWAGPVQRLQSTPAVQARPLTSPLVREVREPQFPPAHMTFSGITLGFAELLSIMACAASLFYGAFALAAGARQPEQALVVVLGCVVSFFYNAALTIVFSYVRQRLRERQRDEAASQSQR